MSDKVNRYAIGENILRILKEKNMSQNRLAKAIGVQPNTISNYMVGKCHPSVFTLYRISIVLETPMEEFMKGTENGTTGR